MNAFDMIYRDNLWNGIESRSGPGSGTAATVRTAEALRRWVHLLGVRSVLDLGCGDGHWMPDVPGYIGIDVSSEALALHRSRHPDRDLRMDHGLPLPAVDLVVTRDAMQHLALAEATAVLARIRASRSPWLLASTYWPGETRSVRSGLDAAGRITFHRPDLTTKPFDLGPPLALLPDGWSYDLPITVRDPSKFLGLWDLRR